MLEMQGIKLFGLQASLQLEESEPAYAGIAWRKKGTFPFGKVQLLNCYHYKLQLAICPYYSARLNSYFLSDTAKIGAAVDLKFCGTKRKRSEMLILFLIFVTIPLYLSSIETVPSFMQPVIFQ